MKYLSYLTIRSSACSAKPDSKLVSLFLTGASRGSGTSGNSSPSGRFSSQNLFGVPGSSLFNDSRCLQPLILLAVILLTTGCSDSLSPDQEYATPRASRYAEDSYDGSDSYRKPSRRSIPTDDRGSSAITESDSGAGQTGFSADAMRRMRRYSEELVTESRYAYDSIRFGREFSTQDTVLEMVLDFIAKARELPELVAGRQPVDSAEVSSLILDLNRESRKISYDLRQGKPTQQITRTWGRAERMLTEIDQLVKDESRRLAQGASSLNTSEIVRIVDELEWEVPTLLDRAKDEEASNSSLDRLSEFNGELNKIAEALERELMDQDAVLSDLGRLVEGWRSTRDTLLRHEPELFNTDEWNRCHQLVRELQKLLPRSETRGSPRVNYSGSDRRGVQRSSRYRQRGDDEALNLAGDSRARRSSSKVTPKTDDGDPDDYLEQDLNDDAGSPFGGF